MPRTKLPIPEPMGTEFENFDRLMKIIATKNPKSVPVKAESEKKPTQRRLPRP